MPPRRIGGDLAAASGKGHPRTRESCAMGRQLRWMKNAIGRRSERLGVLPTPTWAEHTSLRGGEDRSGEAIRQRTSPGTACEVGA